MMILIISAFHHIVNNLKARFSFVSRKLLQLKTLFYGRDALDQTEGPKTTSRKHQALSTRYPVQWTIMLKAAVRFRALQSLKVDTWGAEKFNRRKKKLWPRAEVEKLCFSFTSIASFHRHRLLHPQKKIRHHYTKMTPDLIDLIV